MGAQESKVLVFNVGDRVIYTEYGMRLNGTIHRVLGTNQYAFMQDNGVRERLVYGNDLILVSRVVVAPAPVHAPPPSYTGAPQAYAPVYPPSAYPPPETKADIAQQQQQPQAYPPQPYPAQQQPQPYPPQSYAQPPQQYPPQPYPPQQQAYAAPPQAYPPQAAPPGYPAQTPPAYSPQAAPPQPQLQYHVNPPTGSTVSVGFW